MNINVDKNIKDDLIGFSEISSDIIKCGDCGLKLLDIVVTETNENRISRGLKPQKTKYKVVDCPKCGGSSFETKVYEGSVIRGPISNEYITEDVDCDVDDEGVIYGTLVLRKR
jgi:predicted nucleic-acid-binding Zn-ribbon protein